MTYLQLYRDSVIETNRSNLVNEQETQRHNSVVEQETMRHNKAVERLQRMQYSETARSNRANEALKQASINVESHKVDVTEQHNVITELIDQQKASIAQREYEVKRGELVVKEDTLGENIRHNVAMEAETQRHNETMEALSTSSEIREWLDIAVDVGSFIISMATSPAAFIAKLVSGFASDAWGKGIQQVITNVAGS